ncbi:hypothetical protein [Brenneria tiliae]|uniref:hypothetical protein n=1 Tax=Brenneria tiliae TaxID=2914984 RepID=UPI0020149BE0|nr:hypothetical protein [Brenneria tiliae]
MIDAEKITEILPTNGCVVVTCKNGSIVNIRQLGDDEHVAALNALIDLAKIAGYRIVKPDGNAL